MQERVSLSFTKERLTSRHYVLLHTLNKGMRRTGKIHAVATLERSRIDMHKLRLFLYICFFSRRQRRKAKAPAGSVQREM